MASISTYYPIFQKTVGHPAMQRPDFVPITSTDIPKIKSLLERHNKWRTCDFTIGGLFMWIDYFHYTMSIVNDTMFIKGVSENDITHTAFSLPIGSMPLNRSIALLSDYCRKSDTDLMLSAVPGEMVDSLMKCGARNIEPLNDWGDYLYEIEPMSTFAGKKLSKKRNHVNRFMADHQDAEFKPLTQHDIHDTIEFLNRLHLSAEKSISADYEQMQTMEVLKDLDHYPFEGAILSVPDIGIVAFTIGEVVGDTLYTHIEKMDHNVTGAGETICQNFCAMMRTRHPELRFVNREEDTGDPGLRQAKLAYHPHSILTKFNVWF